MRPVSAPCLNWVINNLITPQRVAGDVACHDATPSAALPVWNVPVIVVRSAGVALCLTLLQSPCALRLLGQEGGQFDLAVHGGSEAGTAVHGGTPVNSDHWGFVAAQREDALQPTLAASQPVDLPSSARAGQDVLTLRVKGEEPSTGNLDLLVATVARQDEGPSGIPR